MEVEDSPAGLGGVGSHHGWGWQSEHTSFGKEGLKEGVRSGVQLPRAVAASGRTIQKGGDFPTSAVGAAAFSSGRLGTAQGSGLQAPPGERACRPCLEGQPERPFQSHCCLCSS